MEEIPADSHAKPAEVPVRQKINSKRKHEHKQDNIDVMLIEALKKSEDPLVKEESSDILFCKSLVPILEKLPRKKKDALVFKYSRF